MTNLPTLHAIHSQTLQDCLNISDNTGAKSCLKIIKDLGNGEKISMMVGICQLLELYTKCSLTAQHSRKFPTSVFEDSVYLTNELEKLEEEWVWWSDPFELCGFGIPSVIINGMSKGVYKPATSEGRIKKAKLRHNIYAKEALLQEELFTGLGLDEDEVRELLTWTPKLAEKSSLKESGDIVIEGFTDDVKKKVEKKLSRIAKKVRTALKERTKHLQVIEHSVRAFSKQNSKVLTSSENFEIEAKERLSGVLESLILALNLH